MARRFSLVLVSSHLATSRAIGGPLVLIAGVLLAFVAVLLLWGISATYVAALFDTGKLSRLERQHARLTEELHELERIGDQFNSRMNQMVRREEALRITTGMPSIPDDIRQVGIGGTRTDLSASDRDATPDNTYSQLKSKLQLLIRQTELGAASFQRIGSKAGTSRKFWQRIPTMKPLEGYQSSSFGMRKDPFTGRPRLHKGVDFGAKPGTIVRAPADGVVVVTGWDRSYGRYIDIDHHNGYRTRYGHLSEILTRRDQQVQRGSQIGIVGQTGRATGEHLHYEVHLHGRLVDPAVHFFPEDTIVD
ncbi:MAG: M23 family metallopeptidase [Candidatus Latescibacteria bacterium]|nr:M23 family metallopeptidase [Candidatus Latescibacterota bacterium]